MLVGASFPALAPAISAALATFGLIFVAELPDKTAFATLALGARLPVRSVVFGVWVAFLVQTVVAVAAGGVIGRLPTRPIRILAGIGFLVFGVLEWRRDEVTADDAELADVNAAVSSVRPAWVTAFLVVLAAEFGDLTQLATATLVAQTAQPLAVGLGALLALWTVTVIAAIAGARLAARIPLTAIARFCAVLFVVVGMVVIVGGVRG